MLMMLSKHGPWKFVDGNATILDHEDEMENYKKKVTKAFALFCEHFMDAKFAHIQYYKNVKSTRETFCSLHKTKIIGNKLFLQRRFFTVKM